MADGTRSQDIRRIEDAIRHLKESSDKQAEAMAGIKDLVSALNLKYEQIVEKALAKKNKVYSKSYNSSLPTSSKSMEPAPKPMESATAMKKMTQKELEERRMKGLCYGCDEKYFRGHVCKKKQLFVIEAEEEEDVFEDVVQEMEKEDVQEELQISVHALSGSLSYKTMRIKEKVKKNMVTILIDSGSTHNFLDPAMAKRTGASIQFTNPLTVVVADGTKLQSKVVVKDFQWVMQGTTFTANMRLLPLGGCDMVLGVQWLSTLGPVLWDFQNLKMEFTAFGKKHVLRGGATVEIQQVEVKAMEKLMQKKPQGIIAQLCSLHSKTVEQEINSDLDRIL
ncbi:hypothetical protein F0562_003736 [Nyssa sinensis]|uniref:Uncharacterized protein n=1 Tax=Nyssa sinensis TaxID=561372 RepID=A0A5J5BZQ2_9ASTE|nr:hypothetical protein F0562_003736 [Nyssa sinensis]